MSRFQEAYELLSKTFRDSRYEVCSTRNVKTGPSGTITVLGNEISMTPNMVGQFLRVVDLADRVSAMPDNGMRMSLEFFFEDAEE